MKKNKSPLVGMDGAPIEPTVTLSDAVADRQRADEERNALLHELVRQATVLSVVLMLEAERKSVQSMELYGERAPNTKAHCQQELEMLADLYASVEKNFIEGIEGGESMSDEQAQEMAESIAAGKEGGNAS